MATFGEASDETVVIMTTCTSVMKVYDSEKQGNWCMTKKYTHLARIYIADMAYMHDNRCLYIITADMIVLTNFVECNLF